MSEATITVRGEAQLEAPPDLVQLDLGVRIVGADRQQVRQQVTVGHAALRALIDEHAAAVRRSWSGGLFVGDEFSPRGRKVIAHRGEVRIGVVFTDFEALPEIIASIDDVDGAFVSGPTWSLSEHHPLRRQVRLAAVEDAKQRAADYAEAVGGTLGTVLEISDLEPSLAWMSNSRHGADGEQSLDLEPEVQQISGQITLRFALLLPDSDIGEVQHS